MVDDVAEDLGLRERVSQCLRGLFGDGTEILSLVGSLGGGGAYVHELLDLALLEALLELVLLGFRESGRGQGQRNARAGRGRGPFARRSKVDLPVHCDVRGLIEEIRGVLR